jgi:heterodisulfide reductase subunit A
MEDKRSKRLPQRNHNLLGAAETLGEKPNTPRQTNGADPDFWTTVDVAVVGGGVAGLRAAIDLQQSGCRVALIERQPHLGGLLPMFDRQFPGDHCGMCRMLAGRKGTDLLHGCLKRGLNLPGVRVMLKSSVEDIQGYSGRFRIQVRMDRKGIHPEKCIGCGRCIEVCPDFSSGIPLAGSGRALRWPAERPIPPVPVWIETRCTRCGNCLEVCPVGAIDLDGLDTTAEIQASRIILAPGTVETNPLSVSEFGHGRYPDVLTTVEWEAIVQAADPLEPLKRPSDGRPIDRAAFILCAGSREMASPWCSAYCCLAAIRQSSVLAQRNPGCAIRLYGIDLRDYAHGGYAYAQEKIRKYGLQWMRCRPSVVSRDIPKGILMVRHLDEGGCAAETEADIVVLMTGRSPAPLSPALVHKLAALHFFQGFPRPIHEGDPATAIPGIFLAGSGPGIIADQVVQGAAAACAAASSLMADRQPREKHPEPEAGIVSSEPSACLILCECRGEIARKIDLEEMKATLASQFRHIRVVPAFCVAADLAEALPEIQGADPLIVGACARIPQRHEVEALLAKVGISWESMRVVNVREHICWGISGSPAERSAAAIRAVARETSEARAGSFAKSIQDEGVPRVLILGAGPAGLAAAIGSARLGLEVVLVEPEDRPGGRLLKMPAWASKVEPLRMLDHLMRKVREVGRISIRTKASLADFHPRKGGYIARIADREGQMATMDFGAVIVAIGAQGAPSSLYPTSQQGPVITQDELEAMLAEGIPSLPPGGRIIMLQCVGSRCEEHPYCSRICCPRAINNALRCRQVRSDIQVEIWYRDLMMPGLLEVAFLEAREKGIQFQRIDGSKPPRLVPAQAATGVQAWTDGGTDIVSAEADLVVLGLGAVPQESAGRLAGALGITLDETGFFRPADPNWRSTLSSRDDIFLAGSAAGPRRLADALISGSAAAQGAAHLLTPEAVTGISVTDMRRCIGCQLCVEVCPAGARSLDPEGGTVQISSRLCMRCGMCAGVCPSGAARMAAVEKDPILRAVESL